MISPEMQDVLAELGKTHYGASLKSYLDDKCREIGDINKAKSWEDTLGRQHAVAVLKEIFSFLEGKDTTIKNKNQYT